MNNDLQYKPRPEGKCGIYFVEGDEAEEFLTKFEKECKELRYGDLVIDKRHYGYHNHGIYIYNGKDIITLATDVDDYGALPREFKVIENGFPEDYWEGTEVKGYNKPVGIVNNKIVWFDYKPYVDQLINNIWIIYIENGYIDLATSCVIPNGKVVAFYYNSGSHFGKKKNPISILPDCVDKLKSLFLSEEQILEYVGLSEKVEPLSDSDSFEDEADCNSKGLRPILVKNKGSIRSSIIRPKFNEGDYNLFIGIY